MDDTEFQTLLRQIACQFILAPEAAEALLKRILDILSGSAVRTGEKAARSGAKAAAKTGANAAHILYLDKLQNTYTLQEVAMP